MNIEGSISRLAKKVDKLALLGGIVSDPIGHGRGIALAPSFAIDRIMNWKIPNLMSIVNAFTLEGSVYHEGLKTAVIGYLAGEGMDIFGMKEGKTVKEASKQYAKGLGLGALIWLPAINPSLDRINERGVPHRPSTQFNQGSSGLEGNPYW